MDLAPYFAPTYFPPAYFSAAPVAAPPAPGAGPSPYNAPTYFAPAYFAGSAAPAAPVTPAARPSPYNAPTYFAPSYFAGSAAPAAPTAPAEPVGRDRAAYAAILARLRATNAFDQVIFGDPGRRGRAGAGHYPLAVVTPRAWEESDDSDPTLIVRRVCFAIRVVILIEDEGEPFDRLDRLSAAVQGVIDRSDLDGSCLAALTRIRSGRFEPAGHYPEWSADLEGEFTSLYDPAATPAAPA